MKSFGLIQKHYRAFIQVQVDSAYQFNGGKLSKTDFLKAVLAVI